MQLINIRQIILNFVKRSVNIVADFLTKNIYCVTNRVWNMDNVHVDLLHLSMKDLKSCLEYGQGPCRPFSCIDERFDVLMKISLSWRKK